MLVQGVAVLSLAHLLLLLRHFECSQVLFKFTLANTMLILGVLKLDLGLLFHGGLLIEVLEHQMLQSLPPDLDRDGVLLLQVLMLTVLVSKLGLLVLELLLGHEPEIIDTQTLIVILTGGNFFLLDGTLKGTTFIPQHSPLLFIIVVIDGLGS